MDILDKLIKLKFRSLCAKEIEQIFLLSTIQNNVQMPSGQPLKK